MLALVRFVRCLAVIQHEVKNSIYIIYCVSNREPHWNERPNQSGTRQTTGKKIGYLRHLIFGGHFYFHGRAVCLRYYLLG